MTYYFQHKEYTDGEKVDIGPDEVSAYLNLTSEYDLENDDIIPLVLDGHVWEEK
jgi:hypothetical protein